MRLPANRLVLNIILLILVAVSLSGRDSIVVQAGQQLVCWGPYLLLSKLLFGLSAASGRGLSFLAINLSGGASCDN